MGGLSSTKTAKQDFQVKELTRNTLTAKLQKIWYISEVEDEHKKVCVARRDILPLVQHILRTTPNATSEEIWNVISDNNADCELEDLYYGATLEDAYKTATAYCSKVGEITADVFTLSDNNNLEIEQFYNICEALCTSLAIDTSDDKLNPQYWSCAFDDELTPIEAVIQSV